MERYVVSMDGNTILLRWQYYLKLSIDSLKALLQSQCHFCRYGKADPQIPTEMQRTLNNQNNIKKRRTVLENIHLISKLTAKLL